jgi:hypothetical protein
MPSRRPGALAGEGRFDRALPRAGAALQGFGRSATLRQKVGLISGALGYDVMTDVLGA